jgi:hypothetical protein
MKQRPAKIRAIWFSGTLVLKFALGRISPAFDIAPDFY